MNLDEPWISYPKATDMVQLARYNLKYVTQELGGELEPDTFKWRGTETDDHSPGSPTACGHLMEMEVKTKLTSSHPLGAIA